MKEHGMTDAIRSIAAMAAVAWRTSRLRIGLAVLLTLLSGASWPVVAVGLSAAAGTVTSGNIDGAVTAGALVAAGVIGALILQHFAYVLYAEASELATVALETELIELTNGSARTEHHESAEYADRITLLRAELPQFGEGMIGLMTALSLTVSMTITSVLLAGVDPLLLLLTVAALPPVLAGRHAQRLLDRAKRAAASDERLCRHMFTLATEASSAKELQVYRLHADLRRRHSIRWGAAGRQLARGEAKAAAISAAGQLFFAAAYVVAVLVVLRHAVAGRSSNGEVILVLTLAAQVHLQVSSGVELLQRLQRMAQGMSRLRWLRELVGRQEPSVDSPVPVPARLREGIRLRDVSFTYPGTDRPVLSGVDLLLPAGQIVAVVGENGAGKTTLAKLLCRFYDVTEGVITVDGVDIRRFPLRPWRARISAAFQDFVRFELTAQQTVGVGDLPRVDDAGAVREALGRARVDDLIERFEHGLATQLGKTWTEGTELSGGQWQKLALGRATMRQGPLLLMLDEPTAALDAQAEHRLFERYADNARRVAREVGGVTLLVSHRFSTVRMADLILVVADGRIAEAGGHDELMRAGGLYAGLYSLQAVAYAEHGSRPAATGGATDVSNEGKSGC